MARPRNRVACNMSKRRAGSGDSTAVGEVFASIMTLTKRVKSMSAGPLAQTKAEFSRARFDFENAKASLLECVSIFGSIQNAASPIAKLPPEILLLIFCLVQGGPTRLLPHSQKEPRTRAWLAVTQVCRHWRIVAENHAVLWRTFELDLHDATPTSAVDQINFYLKRSGTTPLRVGINALSSAAHSKAVVKALSSDLHRVEELTVCALYMIPTIDIWLPISDMLRTNKYPRLRALQLNVLGPNPPAFDQICPHLESLSLKEYVDPRNIHVQSIRQLQLSSQRYKSWSQLQAMSAALKELPQLEDLWFEYCDIDMAFSLNGHPVPVAAVHIPQLRKLAFNSCKEHVTAVISGIFDLKAQQELALMCTVQDEENPYLRLMQALFFSMPTPSDDSGWALHIEFQGDRSSVTFASTSCALRFISRDFLWWKCNKLLAKRLTAITTTVPVKKICLRVLADPDVDDDLAHYQHPMSIVLDLMFDLVDRRCPTAHHFQLPELSRKAVDDYLDRKKRTPPRQTYHFYPSPGIATPSEDKEMLTCFSKWAKKARAGGIKNIMFHTSGSPPQLQLPPVCSSSSERCWTWPGWGPNAAFNSDGSDEVQRRKTKSRVYGFPF